MARIVGVEPGRASWFTRLVYWAARRKTGQLTGLARVVEPLKVLAHHARLLRATIHMELGQDAARSVPAALKALASLKVATLVGCPF
jgi:hypothetical protein